MTLSRLADAFEVLGIPTDASEEAVRARYLELVKRYPPDREPEKFQEVRAAYEAARDPLTIASQLIRPPSDPTPTWAAVIDEQAKIPPKLQVDFLLSLGNRAAADDAAKESQP